MPAWRLASYSLAAFALCRILKEVKEEMAREGGREAASERGWEGVTARMLRRGSGAAAVQITGATGPNAAHINGVYRPVAGEGVGGKPVYKKDGADTWIEYRPVSEYRPGKEQWQLLNPSVSPVLLVHRRASRLQNTPAQRKPRTALGL